MGVDIGTSGCKAVVFDEEGRTLSAAYREYDLVCPQSGWAELDDEAVIDKSLEVIAQAAASACGGTVRGVGISSQGEAFTPVDAEGRALCRAMVSSDMRAADIARTWPAEFGADRLYQITGHTAHPMFSLFKLLWLKANRRDVWTRAAKFLCFEDLLAQRLGVDPAMGWPLAGRTMLFDVRKHQWSAEILDAIGLSADRLARPMPSGTVSGRVARGVAAKLGLSKDVAVVTGGHDQTCGALGAGATRPGVAMYAAGTVDCITPAFARPTFAPELQASNLCTYDHTAPNTWATVAFSLTGGNLLKWFREEFARWEVEQARQTGRSPYELLLEQVGESPSGLLVLPYFTPSGTPYFDTRTPGAIYGLRLTTTRAQVLRALLEGVAFEMRWNLDILSRSGCEVRELRAIGGGAKSRIWMQCKADVLGKSISIMDVTEAGCLGAAMLAKAALDGLSVVDLAESWVRALEVVDPNPAHAHAFTGLFQEYRRLQDVLRAFAAG